MDTKASVFQSVASDSVIEISGLTPTTFVRPCDAFLSGKPTALQQDSMGYLVPDPALTYRLHLEGREFAKKAIALTRQSCEMMRRIIAHQDARMLDGIHQMEKYLVLEGSGGIGKSYTVQCLFGRLGVPLICDKIPPDVEMADEKLFGNPQAINPDPSNVIETTRAMYNGRGFRNPETVKFLKEHPRELYLALYPGPEGWFQKNPKAYSSFWTAVAGREGITQGQRTIPVMGLLERSFRNGYVLFLDELNRIKKGTLDLCMRAFEEGKHLETNIGVLLASERHPGAQIIGAQNGNEPGYNVAETDRAHLRRQKKPPLPDFTEVDYKEYLEFLITGSSPSSSAVRLKGETADQVAVGASCTREFLDTLSEVDGKKVPQKDKALLEFARLHMHMEAQINQAIKGEGLMDGLEHKTNELIATGPSLMKEFVDRVYQLVAFEQDGKGVYHGIEQASLAFEECYIDPLKKRGVPDAELRKHVNFGTYGDPQATYQVNKYAIGHFVSMFTALRQKDLESLGSQGGAIRDYLEPGGIYPGVGKDGSPVMGVAVGSEKNGKKHVTLEPYKLPIKFPLLPKAKKDIMKSLGESIAVEGWDDLQNPTF